MQLDDDDDDDGVPQSAGMTPTSDHTGKAGTSAHEPLSCVRCRARKLRCDKTKPVCTRCSKQNGECIYPESRKKPIAKRKNIKELEERLAQMEGLLRNVAKRRAETSPPAEECDPAVGAPPAPATATAEEEVGLQDWLATESAVRLDGSGGGGGSGISEDYHLNLSLDPAAAAAVDTDAEAVSQAAEDGQPGGGHDPLFTSPPLGDAGAAQFSELMGLGQFETLPPLEIIEDLHRIFFDKQRYIVPVVQQARYLRSFYSTAPHMRPPMCLQYAIWSMASRVSHKYTAYHDIFYRRCRQYLEADELRGEGEHFITVAHAQSWILIATDEARSLFFTRASMSTARCIRMTNMMGLHRLDSSYEDMVPPSIFPAQTWYEKEERRRIFWAAFCIDCHTGISTGWSNMIDPSEIATNLPASEEAFKSGEEEKTCTLQEALDGASYSSFAGSVIIGYIFNRLVKHAYRPMPTDHPEDLTRGPFWKRHREIDNILSTAFMCLPEHFKLPKNIRDPVALQMNLNLHASVISLHNAARINAEKHGLEQMKQISRDRLMASASEVVHIMRLAVSQINLVFRSPMAVLALYLAAYVFTGQAKEDPEGGHAENLEFLFKCMGVVGRQFNLTLDFAHETETMVSIHDKGILLPLKFPFAELSPNAIYPNMLLFAHKNAPQSSQPLLPGRLRLVFNSQTLESSAGFGDTNSVLNINNNTGNNSSSNAIDRNNHNGSNGIAAPSSKRKRTSLTPRDPETATNSPLHVESFNPTWVNDYGISATRRHVVLPHRISPFLAPLPPPPTNIPNTQATTTAAATPINTNRETAKRGNPDNTGESIISTYATQEPPRPPGSSTLASSADMTTVNPTELLFTHSHAHAHQQWVGESIYANLANGAGETSPSSSSNPWSMLGETSQSISGGSGAGGSDFVNWDSRGGTGP